MITTFAENIEAAIAKVFPTWWDDEARTLHWDHRARTIAVPCHTEGGCDAAYLVVRVTSEGEQEEVWVEDVTGVQISLLFDIEGQRHREFIFTVPYIDVIDGDLHDILERLRTQIEFDIQAAEMPDVATHMQAIATDFTQ